MWIIATAIAGVPEADVNDTRHPIAVGVRTGVWTGPYQAPLIGGNIKIRAAKWIGLNGFSDHTLMVKNRQALHDHIIGFNGYFPTLLGNKRAYISPTLGSCVNFQITSPLDDRLPTNNSVLFGVHGGVVGEVALWHRLSFEASATAFAYLGNGAKVDDWSASSSNTYQVTAVGQFIAGLNYAL